MIIIEIFRKSCFKKRDLQELILNDSNEADDKRLPTFQKLATLGPHHFHPSYTCIVLTIPEGINATKIKRNMQRNRKRDSHY